MSSARVTGFGIVVEDLPRSVESDTPAEVDFELDPGADIVKLFAPRNG